jgi:hypothetical protein
MPARLVAHVLVQVKRGTGALRIERGRDRLALGVLDVGDDDTGALPSECLAVRLAETLRAAGHERHLA